MNEEIARRRREFFEPTTSETRPKNDLKLTDLPVEILEEIFYFLPADIICKDIHRTCKRLYKTARSPVFWSSYLKLCKGFDPISSRIVDPKPWIRALAFEQEENRWQRSECLKRYRSAQVHGATVDALIIHETKNGARIGLSGARDRSIVLWDLKNVVENESDNSTWSKVIPMAHTVWTIAMSEDDKTVFSGGFDSMLKQWELVDGTLKQVRQLSNNNVPVLKCIVERNILYSSTFAAKILVTDIREGLEPVNTINVGAHNALNCMASKAEGNYVYALSTEPGKLYCIDKRQMRVVRTCGGFKQCTSLDLDSDSLVASWKNGMVKYLDPQTLTTEYTWVCPAPPEMKSVHPVRLSKGAFIYGSSYELLVYTAGKNPRLLGRLPTKEMIISLDYKNGDLACGMSEGVVLFWPRENRSFSIIE